MNFSMTSTQIFIFAALFSLLIPGINADNYQPLPGSFRPPSLGGTSQKQAGSRQDNSQFIGAPSQQQAWTSQPYGRSPNYYLPAPQPVPQVPPVSPVPQYQQQGQSTDTWRRSMSINPGNMMNNMFGFRQHDSYGQPTVEYQPSPYQAPTFPQPIYYGSSYPLQYGHTPAPMQQPALQQPLATPPSQPVQTPAPFKGRRPFGGEDMRFRPPELKGTD